MRLSLLSILIFFGLTLRFSFVYGGEEGWSLRLGPSQMSSGGTLSLEDDRYLELGSPSFVDKWYRMRLILGIEEREDIDYGSYTAFTYSADILITPYDDAGAALTAYTQTLEVAYDPSSGQSYVDLDVYEFSVHKATVSVTSVTVTGGSYGSTNPGNVYLELVFEADRYYEVESTTLSAAHHFYGENATTFEQELLTSSTAGSDVVELELYWDYSQGAEEYELEWTWVDDYSHTSLATVRSASSIVLKQVDFERNSSRIITTDNFYRLPMVYGRGYLVYRVRAVGRWLDDLNLVKYGPWTDLGTGHTHVSDWSNIITIDQDHQQLKNWQYQATYAENGKKKEVVSYFDGSLRSRQSVTRMNTENNAIVGEQIYDNQGRAAIQVLPVPTGRFVVGYYDDLNRNTTGDIYTHYDFDWEDAGSSTCGSSASTMSSASGASKYYSSNNDELYNWQDEVPDAELYPYMQTEYTPDNTGRVRRKGGVGPTYQLGSGHETQYFYLQATQEELNRLFGYKVGNKARYKKNMVIDANGQVSVSYLDPQGRVIATAIAGDNTANLVALDDEQSTTMHRTAYADLLNKADVADADNDLDDNILYSTGTLGVYEDALRMSTQIGVVEDNSTYTFNYTAAAGSYSDSCMTANGKCYPYTYDLSIRLQDDCSADRLDVGAVSEVLSGSSTDYTSCTDLSFTPSDYTASYLETGSYTLTKVIKVDQAQMEVYLQDYLASACLYSKDDFLDLVDSLDCYVSCDSCVASLGTRDDYITSQLAEQPSMTQAETTADSLRFSAEYTAMLAACTAPCTEPSDCDIYKAALLADVSPGGQYGNRDDLSDPLSVFNQGNSLGHDYNYNTTIPTFINNSYEWKNPSPYYVDEFGQRDSVTVCFNATLSTPGYEPATLQGPPTGTSPQCYKILPEQLTNVSDFLDRWKPSWAEALVGYHPEHCYLDFYDTICSRDVNGFTSTQYDFDLLHTIDTYDKARQIGSATNDVGVDLLADSSILLNDPFYAINNYSFLSGYSHMTNLRRKTLMLYALNTNYQGTGKSMLEVAMEMVYCGSALGGCDMTGVYLTTMSSSQQDQVWSTYKSLYTSFKTQVVELYADLYSIGNGCNNSCMKDGSSEDAFVGAFSPDYSAVVGVAGIYITDEYTDQSDYYITNEVGLNTPGTCQGVWSGLYQDKQARFTGIDVLYNTQESATDAMADAENTADYTTYMATGVCPLASDLQYLLNGLAGAGSIITTTPINTNNAPYFTTDLYTAMGGSPTTTGVTMSSTGSGTGDLSISVSTISGCDITLSVPTGLDWSTYGSWQILGFSNIHYTSYSSPLYSYEIVAQVVVGSSPMQEFVLHGTTCAAIGECGTDPGLSGQIFNSNTPFSKPCTTVAESADFKEKFTAFLNALGQYIKENGSLPNPYLPQELTDLGPYLNSPYPLGVTHIDNRSYTTITFAGTSDEGHGCNIVLESSLGDEMANFLYFTNVNFSSGTNFSLRMVYLDPTTNEPVEMDIKATMDCIRQDEVNCPCVPQTIAPLSCTDQWTAFSTGVVTQVTDYALPSYLTESYFCNNNLAYISTAYLAYLSTMGVTSVDDDLYLTIGSFGNTGLNYGYNDMATVISAYNTYYGLYLDTATVTFPLSWNDYVNTIYLVNNTICPPPPFHVQLDTVINIPCNQYEQDVAGVNAQNQYDIYLAAVAEEFRKQYIQGAMKSLIETFNMNYPDKEYQYTLYYYDQAGNLVQTVPPEGVDRISENTLGALSPSDLLTLNGNINSKRLTSPDANDGLLAPAPTLQTKYKYNSLNQLVWQSTPDGGESRFAYDRLGRLVISQNAKQKNGTIGLGTERFSYTSYDGLGRVVEVGEMILTLSDYTIDDNGKFTDGTDNTFADAGNFPNNLTTNREEITYTLYDEFPVASQGFFADYSADNARNRIAATFYQETYLANYISGNFNSSSAYDYDVHGNVKELLQFNLESGLLTVSSSDDQRIKSVQYDYDLVSGNVNEVTYQNGKPDEFHHRYTYDADNRIRHVETSRDEKIWEQDAKYFYYDHGPLARTEIGDKKVQASDYVYTLQGWMKSVNGEELNPSNDMGNDGKATQQINSQVAQDAFGYSLSYFSGDYLSRIAGATDFLSYSSYSTHGSPSANLYNGNIHAMSVALMDEDENEGGTNDPIGTINYQYQYDQLNRIKSMESYTPNKDGITWADELYSSDYAYDRNGNITTLGRVASNGSLATPMDDFTYDYIAGTNKLALVHDADAGSFTQDIDDQVAGLSAIGVTYDLATESTHNYRYNQIGQLIADQTQEIASIEWTVTGKVKKITRSSASSQADIEFEYDPMGNRITKIVSPKSSPGVINVAGIKKYYYFRDAQGNTMAMYTLENSGSDKNLELTERDIYGSSRLGLESINQVIASTNSSNININTSQQRKVGDKNYELSNHLGNVLEVITDRKLPESTSTVTEEITPTLTDLSGVSVTAGVITRTVAGSSWGPSGGGSVETVGPNDFFEWTLGGTSYLDNSYIMCGLSYTNPDNNYTTMKYGWYTWVGGAGGLTIFESGVCVSGTYGSYGAYAPGGVLKVARESGYIKYYYNGVLKRSVVDAHPTYDMIVDFTLNQPDKSIYGLKVQTQTQIEAYKPDVITFNDYFPFGMQMSHRQSTDEAYRYGFQGQEKDNELKGEGNSLNFKYRMHDPRIGRFFATDPLAAKYPHYSPYSFSGNKVINSIELEGLEEYIAIQRGNSYTFVWDITARDRGERNTIMYVSENGDVIQNTRKLIAGEMNHPFMKTRMAMNPKVSSNGGYIDPIQHSFEGTKYSKTATHQYPSTGILNNGHVTREFLNVPLNFAMPQPPPSSNSNTSGNPQPLKNDEFQGILTDASLIAYDISGSQKSIHMETNPDVMGSWSQLADKVSNASFSKININITIGTKDRSLKQTFMSQPEWENTVANYINQIKSAFKAVGISPDKINIQINRDNKSVGNSVSGNVE